jgi:peptidoglycan-N-acetylglucosamine deacetylase
VTATEFQADVLRNHALLQELPGFTRLFRFPFLKEGDSAEERDEIRTFLRKNGYRSGRVTIDASDWYYDSRLRRHLAAHPGSTPDVFRRLYLEHLWDRSVYYDRLSRKVLGRSVKHTLLLHVNALNAALLPDVIRMYRERGWKIVTPSAAFADPVYRRDPKTVPAGESLVWSLAKEKGVPDLRYPAENDTYERPVPEAAGF